MIPSTGELILNKPEWFNFETVINSFREFIKEYPVDGGMHMILDNAPWHKKAVRLIQTEALPEYQDIREKLTFLFLPTYSPDLNPIEQCWRITRREMTHNTYYKNIDSLSIALDGYFSKYRIPNDKFASLCSFKHNEL